MHLQKNIVKSFYTECFAKYLYFMFYNIVLTRHFNVVKHFHVTFLNVLENVLCLLLYMSGKRINDYHLLYVSE